MRRARDRPRAAAWLRAQLRSVGGKRADLQDGCSQCPLWWPLTRSASGLHLFGHLECAVGSKFANTSPLYTLTRARCAVVTQVLFEARRIGMLDLDSFVALVKEDAIYTMPPVPQWYAGRAMIALFFEQAWRNYGGFRLVQSGANRQSAFGVYARKSADAPWTAHSIQVLTLEHDMISALTLFVKPSGPRLFHAFGLPPHCQA
jgi:hypothetical protein